MIAALNTPQLTTLHVPKAEIGVLAAERFPSSIHWSARRVRRAAGSSSGSGALAGLPAVAMAYLSEEMEPRGLATAMGLYIAGSALGGFLGRFLAGVARDITEERARQQALEEAEHETE